MRQQARQAVPSQPALLGGDGVQHRHVPVARGSQRRGLGLADARRRQRGPQVVLQPEQGVVRHRSWAVRPQRVREGVVAVHAGHLLDQVHLPQRVAAAPTGNAKRERDLLVIRRRLAPARALARRLVPQRFKQARDLVRRERHAQHPRHARGPHRHDRGRPRRRTRIEHRAVHGAPRHGQHQRRGPQHRGFRRLGVHAALEAVAGLGGHPQRPSRRPHLTRLEQRALEQHVRRPPRHLRVRAAHDAGHGHGPLRVSNREHVRRKRPLLAVQRDHRLAGTSAAHHDGCVRQLGQVEGVQRLSQLQHDVVRGVHDVVDGTRAGRPETVRQPRRRRPHDDAPNHRRQVAGTQPGLFDPDAGDARRALGLAPGERRARGRRALPGRPARERRQDDPGAPLGVQLPRHARMAQQVAPVGRDLHVQPHVVQPHGGGERRARLVVPVQQHDAFVVGPQPQLALRAQHSFAAAAPYLAAPDLEPARQHRPHRREGVARPRPHVGRAAHHRDLARRPLHRAQGQAVGVGMGAGFQHAPHHHVAQSVGQVRERLDRRAAQGQAFRRRFGRRVQPRRQVLQPAPRDLHGAAPVTRTAPGSACRSRRRGAGRGRRGAAWRSGPAPCRTPSPCSARGRSPRSPARPGPPCPHP